MSFPPAPLSQDIPEAEGSLAERIETPHDHDVLAGRGNFVSYHPGNEHFRGLVRKHKVAYVACPKPQKGNFSKLIFDEIKSLNPPGRFLKQDAKTKLWYEIPEKKALDKTRQALREGAPEIHKELTGEVDDDASPEHCRDSIGSSDFDSPVKLPVSVIVEPMPNRGRIWKLDWQEDRLHFIVSHAVIRYRVHP